MGDFSDDPVRTPRAFLVATPISIALWACIMALTVGTCSATAPERDPEAMNTPIPAL
jgi:hypothetical protein